MIWIKYFFASAFFTNREILLRSLLLTTLILAFAVRLGAALYWENRYARGELYYGDSPGYWVLADAIAHSQPYQYGEYGRIFRTPGYPAVIATGMRLNEWLTGSALTYWRGRIIGALIGVGCVWLLWKIGCLAFNPAVGLCSAFWGAIYPEFVMLSVLILADSLFCLLILAQIFFWIKTFCRPKRSLFTGLIPQNGYSEVKRASEAGEIDQPGKQDRFPLYSALLAGFFAGFACLTRPGWLYFTPCAVILMTVVFFLLKQKEQARRQLLSGLVMTICCFAVLFPWALRNYRVSGEWIWTTCQGGPSLWDGLNPQADGSSNMLFMPKTYREVEHLVARELGLSADRRSMEERTDILKRIDRVELDRVELNRVEEIGNQKQVDIVKQTGLFDLSQEGLERDFVITVELETNRLLTERSLNRLTTDWSGCLHLAWIKFCRTWSPWPNQESFRSLPILLVFSLFYSLLLIFLFFGLIRASQNREFCLLFFMISGYFVFLHVIFVGSIRYRQPVLWFATIFFAWGVVQAFDRWHLRAQKI